jgi:hypothetical protein
MARRANILPDSRQPIEDNCLHNALMSGVDHNHDCEDSDAKHVKGLAGNIIVLIYVYEQREGLSVCCFVILYECYHHLGSMVLREPAASILLTVHNHDYGGLGCRVSVVCI